MNINAEEYFGFFSSVKSNLITAKDAENAKPGNNVLCDLCVLCGALRTKMPSGV